MTKFTDGYIFHSPEKSWYAGKAVNSMINYFYHKVLDKITYLFQTSTVQPLKFGNV